MKVFDHYAECYDALYRDKDYRGETAFIRQLLRKHGITRSATLLDLGCGTGAYTALLAEHCAEITGIDLSRAMLHLAEVRRKKLPARTAAKISFRHGDVRTLRMKRKFDAVLSMFHVLSYQVENRDLLRAFETAARLVPKNGIFLCDFWHGPGVLTEPPERRVKKVEDPERKITRLAAPKLFPGRNAVLVQYDITLFRKPEKKTYRIKEKHLMRYLFRPELEELCRRTGFRLLEFGEWMTAREPSLKTWCAYLVARKV